VRPGKMRKPFLDVFWRKRMARALTPKSAAVEAEALEWVIRVQHPEFADWDALSAWLAADPRHAEIFERLALLDDEIAALLGGDPLA
jgi:ferric-dicitrate binding protein FerR (iron transport regulator)